LVALNCNQTRKSVKTPRFGAFSALADYDGGNFPKTGIASALRDKGDKMRTVLKALIAVCLTAAFAFVANNAQKKPLIAA
jgi:hypothetical protein